MNAPTHIDPFHLASLSEDINEQCIRIVTRDLPKIVDATALDALKLGLRDETLALLTEMTKEWGQTSAEVEGAALLGTDWVIPTVPMMAEQMPKIYAPPSENPSRDELKQWHIERLRWIMGIWLQVWGQFSAHFPKLDSADDAESPTPAELPEPQVETSFPDIPRPWEAYSILSLWQMIRVLTLEYLQEKAKLLTVLEANYVSISINVETKDTLAQAKDAFWKNQADAAVLLTIAVREALLSHLKLRELLRRLPLDVPTSSLLVLAYNAGVRFPHAPDVLSNLLLDLEHYQNICERPLMSYLYPTFRILTHTAEELHKTPARQEVCRQAAQTLQNLVPVRTSTNQNSDLPPQSKPNSI